jgi:DHA1 family bicyclomycin/chloramphenicol resistance-like MFS transporter
MFYLLAAINAALAVAIWFVVPESLPADRRHTGGLRQTARAFRDLARDRVFVGYALTVAFAYASLFGYIAGSSFALQEHYGLSATQFSAVSLSTRPAWSLWVCSRVLPPLFVVVAMRGLVSSNATVLGVERGSRAAGSASAVLGACMFGGGVLVSPLVGLGSEGSPVPMALVVAGGAVAALLATVLLTRSRADVHGAASPATSTA